MLRSMLLLAMLVLAAPVRGQEIKRVKDASGHTAASIVGEVPLIHTTQVWAQKPEEALIQLERIIQDAGGERDKIMKINVVVANQPAADATRELFKKRFDREHAPAVSYVVGSLPKDAVVAFDAVAIAGSENAATPHARILPAGPRVYISGQAEKAANVTDATCLTLAKLMRTLEFIGAKPHDVIQARCFLTPISAADGVIHQIHCAFGQPIPIAFVEWKSDLPIEIELIAKTPAAAEDAPPMEYLTPPGMSASPLFARVVRVNRGDLIYFAGMYSPSAGTGEQQVTAIFDLIAALVQMHGSNMQHLAKATYYVSDDDASRKLNELRPRYYDPKRPPAASKAMVQRVGIAGRSITIDMIAVIPR
jgi:enamine deaminase RidA (YjgF/YER057c/UK114 family)